MGNAHPALKEASKYVIRSNDEDGVVEEILRRLEIEL